MEILTRVAAASTSQISRPLGMVQPPGYAQAQELIKIEFKG